MQKTVMSSSPGAIQISADNAAIVAVEFSKAPVNTVTDDPLLAETVRQLTAYFAGELHRFDLPLAPNGTPFQQDCWQQLLQIPYGETRSYAWQANAMEKPKATRAVGAANGRNPIAIIIPCHRVIGSNGRLTGYAGGLDIKQALLALETRQQFTLG